MSNIQIRKARIEDLEFILLLSDELTILDLPYDKEVDVQWAHTDNGVNYYTKKIEEKNGVCFIAEHNEKIVGYFTATIKEIPSYRLVKIADLENLVVNKEMRSKGIGKKLIEKFIEWAKEINMDRVSVNVFSMNEKGVAFYKREGFSSYDNTLEMTLR